MTPEERAIRGGNAQALLNNKILQEAFDEVRRYFEARALEAKTTDAEACKDIIRCKQIADQLERAIRRTIEDGKLAQKELERIAFSKRIRIFER